MRNYSVAVKEVGKEIIFLRKIVNGGADQSYGIEVAKLAGLPDSVILRAKGILKSLENTKDSKKSTETPFLEAAADISNKSIKPLQLSFTDLEKDTIVKELASLDILNLTPMEGFNKLFEFIKKAKSI